MQALVKLSGPVLPGDESSGLFGPGNVLASPDPPANEPALQTSMTSSWCLRTGSGASPMVLPAGWDRELTGS